MKYEKIYHDLCARGQLRPKPSISERHHIIPKCMGGSNDKSNLTNLTPREHFIAHQLLYKIYPNDKGILYSAVLMSTYNKYKIYGRKYEWLKILAKSMPGPMKGRKFSEASKQKMSLAGKGKPKSDEMRKNLSASKMGKPLSDAHKLKLSNKLVSEETRKKLSIAASKRRLTEEQKQHLSKIISLREGKALSEEAKQKIGNAIKKAAKDNPKVWITNGIENRLVTSLSSVPDNWYRGRKLKS